MAGIRARYEGERRELAKLISEGDELYGAGKYRAAGEVYSDALRAASRLAERAAGLSEALMSAPNAQFEAFAFWEGERYTMNGLLQALDGALADCID